VQPHKNFLLLLQVDGLALPEVHKKGKRLPVLGGGLLIPLAAKDLYRYTGLTQLRQLGALPELKVTGKNFHPSCSQPPAFTPEKVNDQGIAGGL
jgi:hypothetical protein